MAKVYLDVDESWKVVNNDTQLFAADGNEYVSVESGVTGLELDQNTEGVELAGTISQYTYQQTGNQLKVFSGNILVATIPVQMDEDGTQLTFEDGTYAVKLALTGEDAGKMTVGESGVSMDEPSPLITTQTQTITGEGTTLSTAGLDTTFVVTPGTYTHTIEGFDAGDVIDFPDGAEPTVNNNDFTDGVIELQWASSGNIVTLQVSDLPIADEIILSGIDQWDTVFGEGTIV